MKILNILSFRGKNIKDKTGIIKELRERKILGDILAIIIAFSIIPLIWLSCIIIFWVIGDPSLTYSQRVLTTIVAWILFIGIYFCEMALCEMAGIEMIGKSNYEKKVINYIGDKVVDIGYFGFLALCILHPIGWIILLWVIQDYRWKHSEDYDPEDDLSY